MLAVAISGIVIIREETWNGLTVLETQCDSSDDFYDLPRIVKYKNRLFGKSGWNSDRNIAYYRTDTAIALAVA